MQERRWYAKNVARGHGTFTRRRSRGEKKCRKNARARETGACAYNRSGIINRNLLGINLASVASHSVAASRRTHACTHACQVISNARPTSHLRVHFFSFCSTFSFRMPAPRGVEPCQNNVETPCGVSSFYPREKKPANKWERERKSHLELNKDLRLPGKR